MIVLIAKPYSPLFILHLIMNLPAMLSFCRSSSGDPRTPVRQ
uniref:Uncharacterized protein n=1 Tax=Arundo donax TaxID=35708 RepID=A0A0A9F5X7_ARUDO